MTKLEEYRKKRQEIFEEKLNIGTTHGGFLDIYSHVNIKFISSFISETEEGMIEIFREMVGEEVIAKGEWPDEDYKRKLDIAYGINQERQRIKSQLPSKIN